MTMSRTLGSGPTTRSASISTSATAPMRSAGADTLDHTCQAEPAVAKITHSLPQSPPTQQMQQVSRQLLADLQSLVSTHQAETDSHSNVQNAGQKTIYGITARNDGIGMTMTEMVEYGASNQHHHRTIKNSFMDFDSTLTQDLSEELVFTDATSEDCRRLLAC